MIERLIVENFQCHKKASLNFAPGVNIIAGTSDSGKSALLKALIWVLTNRPQGLGFRHWDCGKGDVMKAAIEASDERSSITIVRNRSESVNEYLLNGKKFVAMKTDVPSDIQEAHGLTTINIQTQFQPHFLLSASSSEVVKVINEACDLSIIDRLLKNIGSIAFKAKADATAAASSLDEAELRFSDLDWVPDATVRLELFEAGWEAISEKIQRKEKMHRVVTEITAIDPDLTRLTARLRFWDSLPQVEQEITTLNEKVRQNDLLTTAWSSLLRTNKEIDRIRLIPGDKLEKVESEVEQFLSLQDEIKELQKLRADLASIARSLSQAEEALDDIKQEEFEAWADTERCPLCEQEIKKS